jgi:hypothetical protein
MLGLTEAKDRVESDVAGLGAAMAEEKAKIEEVWREGTNPKVQPSKVNQDVTNLKQELGKLKEEMRELQVLEVVMTP